MSNLVFSYVFSFIGSLTPGTINLSVLQSSLENRTAVALRMAGAAAIIEYLYAWIAVSFEKVITSTPVIITNLHLIAAIVMTGLGLLTLFSASKPSGFTEKFYHSGFKRGILLGILNPLAMPYWIGVTAYFKSQGWINLNSTLELHSYLLGVSLGVFTLLVLVTFGAKKLYTLFLNHSSVPKKVPGYIMLGLGIYAFIKYFAE